MALTTGPSFKAMAQYWLFVHDRGPSTSFEVPEGG